MKYALPQRNRLRIPRGKHLIGQAHPSTIVPTYGVGGVSKDRDVIKIVRSDLLIAR
jgi:hypothetical protein